MATYLDRILEAHRAAAADDGRPLDELVERARAMAPARDFAGSLARNGLSVIAEVKRRSPSKGDLAADLDPAGWPGHLRGRRRACLSVLTDAEFFGGSPTPTSPRPGPPWTLPVLRKDFTVSERDVCDARLMGADACCSSPPPSPTASSSRCTAWPRPGPRRAGRGPRRGRARTGPGRRRQLVGVNQRDLVTFEVDHDRAVRVGGPCPRGGPGGRVGGPRPADARRLAAAGYDAVLVGESLVTAG
jgi:indole-3-glycerol phosphate synthase